MKSRIHGLLAAHGLAVCIGAGGGWARAAEGLALPSPEAQSAAGPGRPVDPGSDAGSPGLRASVGLLFGFQSSAHLASASLGSTWRMSLGGALGPPEAMADAGPGLRLAPAFQAKLR